MTAERLIVVGIDASAGADAALEEALADAVTSRAQVRWCVPTGRPRIATPW